MRTKKGLMLVVLSIIFIISVLSNSLLSYAQTANTPLYLGITELKLDSNMGYAIGDPNTGATTSNAAKIWNIVKYSTSTSNDPTEANIYCLKAGVGFENVDKRATYDVFYDMKNEKTDIANQNEILRKLVEGTITTNDTTVSQYSAILAILDMFYYDGISSESDKTSLLSAAGIRDGMYTYSLTDDDIEAVQQSALWYFTNYGEEDGKYDMYNKSGWLNYTLNGTTYTSLSDYNLGTGEGTQRQLQAETLYNYLIRTALERAPIYDNITEQTEPPAKVDTTTLNYETNNSTTILGPIHISETENNIISYDIEFSVKADETEVENYSLLDENKQEVSAGTTIKDLVGQDFYISVPTVSANNEFTVDININYSNTKLTLWASNTNDQEQPVVIPEKEDMSIPTKLETQDKGSFDLALRKYITKVNGVELTGANIRVPDIDESSLTSGTTATYKHKKDPIVIETGDVITYSITVYNEGDKQGFATKIVDQLPEGLTFSQVVSGNFVLDSYNETTNELILNRPSIVSRQYAGDYLDPYTQGNLDSETIEIECIVTATPDTQNSKVLTNVAWISEEYNAEDDILITNQEGEDRDSEPSTTPDVNKDNMSDYTGNGNKSDLTDSDYYYKGQQDDDDFEKLVLLPEAFDLKLIKRIVAVNDQNVPERIESIDVSDLNVTDSNGNIVSTTADYQLNKEPVGVKKVI